MAHLKELVLQITGYHLGPFRHFTFYTSSPLRWPFRGLTFWLFFAKFTTFLSLKLRSWNLDLSPIIRWRWFRIHFQSLKNIIPWLSYSRFKINGAGPPLNGHVWTPTIPASSVGLKSIMVHLKEASSQIHAYNFELTKLYTFSPGPPPTCPFRRLDSRFFQVFWPKKIKKTFRLSFRRWFRIYMGWGVSGEKFFF